MSGTLAYNLCVEEDFLIYIKSSDADCRVVPLKEIDAVALYRPHPDKGMIVVFAGGNEVFHSEYDAATAARLQKSLTKLIGVRVARAA